MLPLSGRLASDTTHPLFGRRPTRPPSRLPTRASAAFVEPAGQPSQPHVPSSSGGWGYPQPPMTYGAATTTHYYPPTAYPYAVENSKVDSYFYPTIESMHISFEDYTPETYAEPVIQPIIEHSKDEFGGSTEAIYHQIREECEEIARRSPSDRGSSPSTEYSSDDSETLQSVPGGKVPAKRERKKAQNREAATRYREKKRKERDEARAQVDGLLATNEQLRTKVTAIQGEISYLKKLMAEIGMKEENLQYISPVVPL